MERAINLTGVIVGFAQWIVTQRKMTARPFFDQFTVGENYRVLNWMAVRHGTWVIRPTNLVLIDTNRKG